MRLTVTSVGKIHLVMSLFIFTVFRKVTEDRLLCICIAFYSQLINNVERLSVYQKLVNVTVSHNADVCMCIESGEMMCTSKVTSDPGYTVTNHRMSNTLCRLVCQGKQYDFAATNFETCSCFNKSVRFHIFFQSFMIFML